MRFRNTLVRDAAYEGLPYRRRQVLHARVGEAIEATAGSSLEEEIVDARAPLLRGSAGDKAWNYCRLAGDRAKAVAANIEAARFYRRALVAGRRLRTVSAEDRAAVWISLGTAQETAGQYEQAIEDLRRATRLLRSEPVSAARVHAQRANTCLRAAAYGAGLRATATGLTLLAELNTKEARSVRASLAAARATIRWYQGHAGEAIELAELAVRDARRSHNLEALAAAYGALDGCYQMIGEPEKAINDRKAVEIYEQLNDVRRLGLSELNLGVQAYADGNWDEAIDWYTRARDDCLRAGDRTHAAISDANLGELLCSRGMLTEADELLIASRRTLRAARATPYALFAEIQIARIALARDRVMEARTSLAAIAEEAMTLGHALVRLYAAIYLAQALLEDDDEHEGLATLLEARTAAGEEAAFLSVPIDRVLGICLTRLRRFEDAARHLEDALLEARRQRQLYEQLLILVARRDLAAARGEVVSDEESAEAARLRRLLALDHAD